MPRMHTTSGGPCREHVTLSSSCKRVFCWNVSHSAPPAHDQGNAICHWHMVSKERFHRGRLYGKGCVVGSGEICINVGILHSQSERLLTLDLAKLP